MTAATRRPTRSARTTAPAARDRPTPPRPGPGRRHVAARGSRTARAAADDHGPTASAGRGSPSRRSAVPRRPRRRPAATASSRLRVGRVLLVAVLGWPRSSWWSSRRPGPRPERGVGAAAHHRDRAARRARPRSSTARARRWRSASRPARSSPTPALIATHHGAGHDRSTSREMAAADRAGHRRRTHRAAAGAAHQRQGLRRARPSWSTRTSPGRCASSSRRSREEKRESRQYPGGRARRERRRRRVLERHDDRKLTGLIGPGELAGQPARRLRTGCGWSTRPRAAAPIIPGSTRYERPAVPGSDAAAHPGLRPAVHRAARSSPTTSAQDRAPRRRLGGGARRAHRRGARHGERRRRSTRATSRRADEPTSSATPR